MNIAVEDQADQLGVLIDRGRAGIAADDVVGRDEIERRARIDCRLFLHPAWRQVVWELILEVRRPIVQTAERRERRNSFTILQVALHGAVRKPQREGRIGINRVSFVRKPRAGNLCVVRALDAGDFVFETLAQLAGFWIDQTGENDHRIGR